jgi:hypothetical protein
MLINIPYQSCFVRRSYIIPNIYADDLSVVPAWWFAVENIINRPLFCMVQLQSGALYAKLPLSALVHRVPFDRMGHTEQERLSNLQYWDMQSHGMTCTTLSFLQHKQVEAQTRTAEKVTGRYITTLSNDSADANRINVGYSDFPDVKQYHLVQLDNGNYGAYPNNYLRVWNADFVDRDTVTDRLQRNTINMWAEDGH